VMAWDGPTEGPPAADVEVRRTMTACDSLRPLALLTRLSSREHSEPGGPGMSMRASSMERRTSPLILEMMSPTKTWPVAAAPPAGLIDNIWTAPEGARLMLTPMPTLAGAGWVAGGAGVVCDGCCCLLKA